jgi:Serine/threonine protein kinase
MKQRRTFSELTGTISHQPSTSDSSRHGFFEQRYELLEPLTDNQDGYATTARDRVLSKLVSIVRFASLSEEEAIHFQGIVKKLSLLQHPDIAGILHFGLGHDNRPFLISDLREGPSLYDCIQDENGLSLDTATDITTKLCECLEYAHSKGVFHGDLNSDNILLEFVDSEPRVYLIEFGYSSIQERSGPAEDPAVGARRDLLSVASLFYEMVTATRPFQQLPTNQWQTLQFSKPDLEQQNTLLANVFSASSSRPIDSIKDFRNALASLADAAPTREDQANSTAGGQPASNRRHVAVIITLIAALSIAPLVILLKTLFDEPAPKGRVTHKRKRHQPSKAFTTQPDISAMMPDQPEQVKFIEKLAHSSLKRAQLVNVDFTPELARKLASAKQLEGVFISNSGGLSKAVFEEWKSLNFRSFALSYSTTDDDSFRPMTGNQNIRSLLLNHVNVGDRTMQNLSECKNLKALALVTTRTSNAGLKYLKALSQLRTLKLELSEDFSDESLKVLVASPPPHLSELYLGSVNISDKGMKYLQELPSLQRIILDKDSSIKIGPNVTDAGIETLLKDKRITGIYLENQAISGKALQALFEASHLQELSFVSNEIPAGCRPTAAKMKHLKLVNLRIDNPESTDARLLFAKIPVPLLSKSTAQLWTEQPIIY